jgi:hypothetical protein
MAAIESNIGVAEGTPTKQIHTVQRSVSAVNVEDQLVVPGEPWKTTYTIIASAISTATAASHLLQIMAGGTLYTRIEKVRIKQVANAGGVAMLALQAFRLTSAGTGGGVVTARPHDSADAAFSGAAMTLPTVKGAEGVQLDLYDFPLRAAIAANEQEHVWTLPEDAKPWIIPAGVANGICFKAAAGVATSTISIVVTLSETSYL